MTVTIITDMVMAQRRAGEMGTSAAAARVSVVAAPRTVVTGLLSGLPAFAGCVVVPGGVSPCSVSDRQSGVYDAAALS
jgi:hypothetical protein